MQDDDDSDGNNNKKDNNQLVVTQKIVTPDRPVRVSVPISPVDRPPSLCRMLPSVEQHDYAAEIVSLRTKCMGYENQIQSQQATIESLRSQLSAKDTSHSNLMKSLMAELDQCKKKLSASSNSSNNNFSKSLLGRSSGNSREHEIESLKLELENARSQCAAISTEYAAAAAMIVDLECELKNSKSKITELEGIIQQQQQREAEVLQRDDGNQSTSTDQAEELLTDLIATKMMYATLATDFDSERVKIFQMKRKLQWYAERVAALEVSSALKVG